MRADGDARKRKEMERRRVGVEELRGVEDVFLCEILFCTTKVVLLVIMSEDFYIFQPKLVSLS